MGQGRCDIGVVQSLMIHVYWKAPTDRTAWAKLGMAIRLGYQFRWYETKKSQVGLDDLSLRGSLVSPPRRSQADPRILIVLGSVCTVAIQNR